MAIVVRSDGTIDAAKYGIVPGVDSTAAFLALIPKVPPNAWIQLGAGGYLVSAKVDFRTGIKNSSHVDHIWLKGAGSAGGLGTSITGTVAGPLICYNDDGLDASTSAHISGISFENFHPGGTCLQLERIDDGIVKNCRFKGNRGLVIGEKQFTNVEIDIDHCAFIGDLNTFPNSIGLAARMIGVVRGRCKFQKCATGMRLSNFVEVDGARLEECGKGIEAGTAPDGSAEATSVELRMIDTESTVRPLVLTKSVSSAVVSTFHVHGTGNFLLGDPTIGIDYQAGAGQFTLTNAQVSGSFSAAGIKLSGNGPVVLIASTSAVKAPAAGVPWLTTMDVNQIKNLGSNWP